VTSVLTFAAGEEPQVVCLGAHCDDIEIGCGGTLAVLAQAWPKAHFHCWVFSGDEVRTRESRRCLELLLGANRFTLQVLGYRDGYFPAEWSGVKRSVDELSRAVKADLVFTHAASDLHQDHRTLAELTWNHFRRHTILEYEIVKYDGNPGPVSLFVPLSQEQLARKVDALMTAFESQTGKAWFTRSTFEAIARLRGVESAAASGYAEAFHARKLLLAPVAQPEHAVTGTSAARMKTT
jgi:LmbE family N-acetylglucosaminyl deacetylase